MPRATPRAPRPSALRRPLLTALLLGVLAAAAPPAGAQPVRDAYELEQRVAAVLANPVFDDAYWGALIVDLETGQTLFSQHANRLFIPASNQKLFVTAAALEQLGPGFRYVTELFVDGEVRGSTLVGDLVVRGAGDPTLGGRRAARPFDAWVEALRERGITRVAGRIIGDDSVFDDALYGKGWAWEDLPYGYAAQVSGLSYHENVVEMTVRGTTPGLRAAVAWEPDGTDYVQVVNRTLTQPEGGDLREGYDRPLGTNRIVVTTEVPAGRADTEAVTVNNPTMYFVTSLRRALTNAGIAVDGPATDGDEVAHRLDYTRMTRVAAHSSPPLGDIVGVINTDSHNLYAEHLLRTLGALRYDGPPGYGVARGSAEAGVLAMRPFLHDCGIEHERIMLVDGSGLSPMNRVSPRQVVSVLQYMDAHPRADVREAFIASLALGGHTGTLKTRYRGGLARGNVRAKTGFINSVRTLSGYVTTASGRRLAFALLCNNYSVPTSRVNQAQDAIVELLASYRG